MRKKQIIFAIFIYIIFPLSSVFMKTAAESEIILNKILFFTCSIITLGIFSIMWQKLLSKINLNKAYLFKSTTIIWSIVYGIIIFKETINFNKILGIVITIFGLCISLGLLEKKKNE